MVDGIMATFHHIFPITFDAFRIFFDFFLALYTKSFARSFASSTNITDCGAGTAPGGFSR